VLVEGLQGAVEIAVGKQHTCARLNDDSVWCWGMNDGGQLGEGAAATESSSPVEVASLGPGGVLQLSAGWQHTCALLADRSVWCWGWQAFGGLGDGISEGSARPTAVRVTTVDTSIERIWCAAHRTCALKSDGSLWCWGNNQFGEIGDGTFEHPKLEATEVAALGSNVADASTRSLHACARLDDGSVWCWGWNLRGQIGDGTMKEDRPSPTLVGIPCP